jgi:hypothetical protein
MIKIALDFDGVIHSATTAFKDIDIIEDEPVKGAKEAIKEIKKAGFEVVIFSSRTKTEKGRKAILNWLRENEIEVDKIPEHKPVANIYLDDRAIQFNGDWKQSLKDLKNFRHYKQKEIEMNQELELDGRHQHPHEQNAGNHLHPGLTRPSGPHSHQPGREGSGHTHEDSKISDGYHENKGLGIHKHEEGPFNQTVNQQEKEGNKFTISLLVKENENTEVLIELKKENQNEFLLIRNDEYCPKPLLIKQKNLKEHEKLDKFIKNAKTIIFKRLNSGAMVFSENPVIKEPKKKNFSKILIDMGQYKEEIKENGKSLEFSESKNLNGKYILKKLKLSESGNTYLFWKKKNQ